MDDIDLKELKRMPCLDEDIGGVMAKAASYCFHKNGHGKELGLTVNFDGGRTKNFNVRRFAISPGIERTFADRNFAVEYGACGIALLLCMKIWNLELFEIGRKSHSFDYYLRSKDKNFHKEKLIRLEVSGVFHGNIKYRLKQKLAQINKWVDKKQTGGGTIVIVTDFGSPMTLIHEEGVRL
jgi:hypothetical protein